jgi:hypothetical protein
MFIVKRISVNYVYVHITSVLQYRPLTHEAKNVNTARIIKNGAKKGEETVEK